MGYTKRERRAGTVSARLGSEQARRADIVLPIRRAAQNRFVSALRAFGLAEGGYRGFTPPAETMSALRAYNPPLAKARPSQR